jgi:lipopolysaccharide export LptBFGC system permease protein LptF
MTVIDFERARLAVSIKDWLKNQTRSVTKYHSYSPQALLKAQEKAKGHRQRWLRFFLVEKISNHLQLLPLLLLAALLSFAPKRNLRGRNWVMALLVFVANYALYQLFRGMYLSNHIPLWMGALGPFAVLSTFTVWLWRKTLRACV